MKKTLVYLAVAAMLAACGAHDEPQYQQQAQQPAIVQQAPAANPAAGMAPAPVIINQAPAQASGGGSDMVRDMMLGGMIGHMIGSSGSRSAAPAAPQIIERRTVINRTYVQTPTTSPQVAPPAKITAAPAPAPSRPSYSQAYTASRPSTSVSRPSYSSSFRSGRR